MRDAQRLWRRDPEGGVRRSGEGGRSVVATLGFGRFLRERGANRNRAPRRSDFVARSDGLVLNQFQPLKLHPVGTDMSEIILRLLYQPAFSAAAKNLRQP